MKREFRTGEIREVGDGRTVEALAVAYGVVDDYGTRFVKGAFAESLTKRMPALAWGHDWSEPVGRITDYRDEDDGLYVTARLSDPDAVPRSRQAIAQLRDGDITDVSIGFMRLADRKADDGVTEITEAEIDEVSLVLRGAVPGAKILATRSGKVEMIDKELAANIIVKYERGEYDLADALVAVRDASFDVEDEDDDEPKKPSEGDDQEPDETTTPDTEEAEAEEDDVDVEAILAGHGI